MTLLMVVKDGRILLPQKKRGFGQGLYNGMGGKVEPGETVEQALVRECQEEIGITPLNYEKFGINHFDILHKGERSHLVVHVFIATDYIGEPQESDEMKPFWFTLDQIPFEKMWEDDPYWLPRILKGEKLECFFVFDDNNKMCSHNVKKVTTLK